MLTPCNCCTVWPFIDQNITGHVHMLLGWHIDHHAVTKLPRARLQLLPTAWHINMNHSDSLFVFNNTPMTMNHQWIVSEVHWNLEATCMSEETACIVWDNAPAISKKPSIWNDGWIDCIPEMSSVSDCHCPTIICLQRCIALPSASRSRLSSSAHGVPAWFKWTGRTVASEPESTTMSWPVEIARTEKLLSSLQGCCKSNWKQGCSGCWNKGWGWDWNKRCWHDGRKHCQISTIQIKLVVHGNVLCEMLEIVHLWQWLHSKPVNSIACRFQGILMKHFVQWQTTLKIFGSSCMWAWNHSDTWTENIAAIWNVEISTVTNIAKQRRTRRKCNTLHILRGRTLFCRCLCIRLRWSSSCISRTFSNQTRSTVSGLVASLSTPIALHLIWLLLSLVLAFAFSLVVLIIRIRRPSMAFSTVPLVLALSIAIPVFPLSPFPFPFSSLLPFALPFRSGLPLPLLLPLIRSTSIGALVFAELVALLNPSTIVSDHFVVLRS